MTVSKLISQLQSMNSPDAQVIDAGSYSAELVVKRPETGEVALVFGRYVSEDDPRG